MKAIYKPLIAAALAAPLFTGCIEESVPTQYILATQLEGNDKAIAAFASAMCSHLNEVATLSSSTHYDWGWPALMHARDVMTEDMVVDYAGGYDWFGGWSQNSVGLGPRYLLCQFPWNYFYEHILTTNNTIRVCDPESEQPSDRFYLGSALAFRAATYLEVGRMYEVLPTSVNTGKSDEGNNIIGLTLPIVTEQTTDEVMRSNPRAPHATLFDFIVNDLETAIPLMEGYGRPDKTFPDVAVAKGLLARAYLWDASFQDEVNNDKAAANASYGKAAQYAREAISASGATPLTQAEWLDRTSGFNTLSTSSWMWGGQYNSERVSNLLCWISFCCNEQEIGYASDGENAAGAHTKINAAMYNRINDADFRKLSYVAPAGTALSGQEPYLDQAWGEQYLADKPYVSLKFRPGEGNMTDYKTANVVAYPLMRVEEMYFIEAEAKAHLNASDGLAALKNFMTTYRYATYNYTPTSDDAIIGEIVFQKRVELWGEGRAFYDFKRLNMSVTRAYEGTNFEYGLNTFNTVGRPAWMNFCIVSQEVDNNSALVGYNTPAPNPFYKVIESE